MSDTIAVASGSRLANIDIMMNRSYEEKIEWSKTVVEKRLNDKSVVALSYGKDSIIVASLVRVVRPDIKIIRCNTGVDYPEVDLFAEKVNREWNLNVETLKPEKNFWECIKDYGWPHNRAEYRCGKRTGCSSPRCCYHLKEKPMRIWMKQHEGEYDNIFLGLTAEESRQRKILFARNGGSPCYFDKSSYGFPVLKVNPIMPWRVTDVWRYIKENNLPICPSYAKWNIPRLGCWPCTSHLGWKKQIQQFAPNVYRRAMHEKESQYLLEEFGGSSQ